MGWLAKQRHLRGYGVHSPFAYALITEAIREAAGYDYYDYSRLATPRERLLYRLAAYFQPRGIAVLGDCHGAAAALACPRGAGERPAGMVVAAGSYAGPEPLEAVARGAIVIVEGAGPLSAEVARSMDEMGHGMTFGNDADLLIAAPLPHLPRQHFEVAM